MRGTLAETLAFLSRSRELTEAVAQSAGDPERRAALLARTLYALGPAPLSACLLRAGERSVLHVLDGEGRPRPDWEKALGNGLAPEPVGETVYDTSPPPGPEWAGQVLGVAPIVFAGHSYGALALALPKSSRSNAGRAGRALLAYAAEHLALLLALESRQPQAPAAEEPMDRPGLNDFADFAYIVGHEFNNALNNILLQAAILELKGMAGGTAQELASIRQMGTGAAALVRQFQEFCRQQQPALEPVDLNAVIRQAVDEEPAARPRRQPAAPAVAVELWLSPDLPTVLGTLLDLKRLIRRLLANAAAADSARPVSVLLRTLRTADQVQLHVGDSGPQVAGDLLARLFEPFAAGREGTDGWTLAVCKAIARRLQGTIEAMNRPEGGMVFVVGLRPAAVAEPE